ncbi:MAG: hypothetical protein PVH37_26215 [Desulfobacterales bacterium]|jgi:hypothetical protein
MPAWKRKETNRNQTMSQTIAEKIISSHCRREIYAGETVVAFIDLADYISSSGEFPSP